MPDELRALTAAACVALAGCAGQSGLYDPPITCNSCEQWNRPQAPFHIYGNTYYVGTAVPSSILIVSDQSLILIDAGLPQSAPLIAANIRELGFDPADIGIIAVSHTHFDHVGGVAAMQRINDATVITSKPALLTLRRGVLDSGDPQFDPVDPNNAFPAVPNALPIRSGDTAMAGGAEIRGVHTPGHTPGGMSWTWQACEEGRCLEVVYADSLSPVAPPGYRFGDGMADQLRTSAARIAALDCDIFLSTHDFSFGLHDKLATGRDAFVDPDGCKRYAARALQRLEQRIAREVEENPR